MQVPRLTARFIQFSLTVSIGALAHYTILIVLVNFFGQGAVSASSVGAVVGALINYWLNYHLVFRSDSRHTETLPKYLLVSTTGFFVNLLMMYLLVELISLHYFIAQIITTLIVLLTIFVLNNNWTFRSC